MRVYLVMYRDGDDGDAVQAVYSTQEQAEEAVTRANCDFNEPGVFSVEAWPVRTPDGGERGTSNAGNRL